MTLLNNLKQRAQKFMARIEVDDRGIIYHKRDTVTEEYYRSRRKRKLMEKKADIHAKLAELG